MHPSSVISKTPSPSPSFSPSPSPSPAPSHSVSHVPAPSSSFIPSPSPLSLSPSPSSLPSSRRPKESVRPSSYLSSSHPTLVAPPKKRSIHQKTHEGPPTKKPRVAPSSTIIPATFGSKSTEEAVSKRSLGSLRDKDDLPARFKKLTAAPLPPSSSSADPKPPVNRPSGGRHPNLLRPQHARPIKRTPSQVLPDCHFLFFSLVFQGMFMPKPSKKPTPSDNSGKMANPTPRPRPKLDDILNGSSFK